MMSSRFVLENAMHPAVGCRGARQTWRKIALPRPGFGSSRLKSRTANHVVDRIGPSQVFVGESMIATVGCRDQTVVGWVIRIIRPDVTGTDHPQPACRRIGLGVAVRLPIDLVPARLAGSGRGPSNAIGRADTGWRRSDSNRSGSTRRPPVISSRSPTDLLHRGCDDHETVHPMN